MKTNSIALSILLTAVLAGCAGSATDLVDPSATYTIQPLNAVQRVLTPGESIGAEALPRVRVLDQDGAPVAGISVTFTRTGSGNSLYTIATDRNGDANLDVWPVGSSTGEYRVTATAGLAPPLVFSAFVRSATLAIYDLSEAVGGLAVGSIHYYLFDDGTFIHSRATPGPRDLPHGQYKVLNSLTIQFLSGSKYPGGVFATGTLAGSAMRVTYTDKIEFQDEVYTRNANEVSPSAFNYSILALTPVQFLVTPDLNISVETLPRVRVLYSNNIPAAGVPVTFARSTDGGQPAYSVLTDGSGTAQLDSWHIGSAIGEYSVTVKVAGLNPLVFTAFIHGTVVAAYDLSEVDADGFQPGSIHSVLFDDGTYTHYYGPVRNNESADFPNGRYKLADSVTIVFSKGFPLTSGLSSIGKLSGNAMRVKYGSSESYDETYSRRN